MATRAPLASRWQKVATAWLPFADAASDDLPLSRLLRLSLFQVSMGMTTVLLNGTLNRVIIVELGVPAWLISLMIALPLLFAPLRALIGHRSDHHRSVLGWRRVPYIWFGTLMQFGGLALMPFALLLMSRADVAGIGTVAAMVAFLMTGAGLHTAQTAGLALATDLAPERDRPRAVALLYVMLLAGMVVSAFVIGDLLRSFTPTRMIQVIQGVGLLTAIFNIIALWKQEPRRRPAPSEAEAPRPPFAEVWRAFAEEPGVMRLLVAVGLGAAGFAMQDILLEPYGGEILGMTVGGTTELTGLWALGNLIGFTYAARVLDDGGDPHRVAGLGGVAGMFAFALVMFAAPAHAPGLLFIGACAIGLGAGLFLVGTLTAAMALSRNGRSGIALGAWGAVQASAAGLAIAASGVARDGLSALALKGWFGAALADRATGYGAVYLIEILLLMLTLAILGPLVGRNGRAEPAKGSFGLQQFPT
ncbi:MFS transporter [Sphingomonas changnyeongensis]|uniref:MFS transporter n=1 Tax=Sphingomonas changnyeongensis TaxID=2698679 RepID=A0A7Z2NXP2_9SPHN|nr:BCD family MFS transporter [Sphingomonas changnyeongensis]QHL91331.1 MFS transporter [Sphingomonas changnyeongensis]